MPIFGWLQPSGFWWLPFWPCLEFILRCRKCDANDTNTHANDSNKIGKVGVVVDRQFWMCNY